MSAIEHISVSLKQLFGGFLPDPEAVAMARQYRWQYLPAEGYCQITPDTVPGFDACHREGCLDTPVFAEICRQINEQVVNPARVCRVCSYRQCVIKKGTVDFGPLV